MHAHRSVVDSPSPAVPAALQGAFLRGLFDGDGHIQAAWSDGFFLSGWNIGLAGSRGVLAAFQAFLLDKHGLAMYDMVKNGTSDVNWRTDLSGPRIFPVLQILYPPEGIGLDRKKRLATTLLEYYRQGLALGLRAVQRGDGYRFERTEGLHLALAKPFFGEVSKCYVRNERSGKGGCGG